MEHAGHLVQVGGEPIEGSRREIAKVAAEDQQVFGLGGGSVNRCRPPSRQRRRSSARKVVATPTCHPRRTPLEKFIARYRSLVTGVLSGFDRLVFRGSLLPLFRDRGMFFFRERAGVRLLDFKDIVTRTRNRVKEAADAAAAKLGRPVQYLELSESDEEKIAKRMLADQPGSSGAAVGRCRRSPSPGPALVALQPGIPRRRLEPVFENGRRFSALRLNDPALRLLRAHGAIMKIPRPPRYRLTCRGLAPDRPSPGNPAREHQTSPQGRVTTSPALR
jgi:hypothetical protein